MPSTSEPAEKTIGPVGVPAPSLDATVALRTTGPPGAVVSLSEMYRRQVS